MHPAPANPPGVATHTDIVGDVTERRSRGEKAVIARRHAPYFLERSVHIICDHVIGDTFETLCFPTGRIVGSLFPPRFYAPSYLKHNLANLIAFLDDVAESSESAFVVRTRQDLEEAAFGRRLGIVLCFQGCSPLEDVAELLGAYFRLGVRILNLSSALVPNLAIGHAQDPDGRGLTEFGVRLVNEAARRGMIVDLAGCSERGFWDVMERFAGPVLASSINCRSVMDRPGNFTDDQIRALAQRGGVMGVIFDARSVGEATVEGLIRHVMHIAEVGGPDVAAVGPNVGAEHMYPKETYERVFRDAGFWSGSYAPGLEDFIGIQLICDALQAHGGNDEQIAALRGGNALRLLHQALGGS